MLARHVCRHACQQPHEAHLLEVLDKVLGLLTNLTGGQDRPLGGSVILGLLLQVVLEIEGDVLLHASAATSANTSIRNGTLFCCAKRGTAEQQAVEASAAKPCCTRERG